MPLPPHTEPFSVKVRYEPETRWYGHREPPSCDLCENTASGWMRLGSVAGGLLILICEWHIKDIQQEDAR